MEAIRNARDEFMVSWGFYEKQRAAAGAAVVTNVLKTDFEVVNIRDDHRLLDWVVRDVRDVKRKILRLPTTIPRIKDLYDPRSLYLGLYGREKRSEKKYSAQEELKLDVKEALLDVLTKEGTRKSQGQWSPNVEDAIAERSRRDLIWSELASKVISEVHRGGERILALYGDVGQSVMKDIPDTAQHARQLLVLDGVFVVCFVIFLAEAKDVGRDSTEKEVHKFNPVIITFSRINFPIRQHLISDLWLFENQVPFVVIKNVLKAILSELEGKDDQKIIERALRRLVKTAISKVLSLLPGDCTKEKSEIDRRIDNIPLERCKHLLECLYRVVCPHDLETPTSKPQEASSQGSNRSEQTVIQTDEFECLFGPADLAPGAGREALKIPFRKRETSANEGQVEADNESRHSSGDGTEDGQDKIIGVSVHRHTDVMCPDVENPEDSSDGAVLQTTVKIERIRTIGVIQLYRPWKLWSRIRFAFKKSNRDQTKGIMKDEIALPISDIPRPHSSNNFVSEYAFEDGCQSIPEEIAVTPETVLRERSVELSTLGQPIPPTVGDGVVSVNFGTTVSNQSPGENAQIENALDSSEIRETQPSAADKTEQNQKPNDHEYVVLEDGLGSLAIRQIQISSTENTDGRKDLQVVIQDLPNDVGILEAGLGSPGVSHSQPREFGSVRLSAAQEIQEVNTQVSEIEIIEESVPSRQTRITQVHDVREGVESLKVGDTVPRPNYVEFPGESNPPEGTGYEEPASLNFEQAVSPIPRRKQFRYDNCSTGGILTSGIWLPFLIFVTVIHKMFKIFDINFQREYSDFWYVDHDNPPGAADEQDTPYATPFTEATRAEAWAFDSEGTQLNRHRQPGRHAGRHAGWNNWTSVERLPTVSDLRKAGIIVKGDSEPGCNLRFKNSLRKPVLYISHLNIDQNTERLLRNLVAFESQFMENIHASRKNLLMVYLSNMNDLVNTAGDVEALTFGSTPVLTGRLLGTPGEVADMFNGMVFHSCPEDDELKEIRRTVNIYSKSKLRRGCTEFLDTQCNCQKPWITISILAAIVILSLTAIQTTLALLDYF